MLQTPQWIYITKSPNKTSYYMGQTIERITEKDFEYSPNRTQDELGTRVRARHQNGRGADNYIIIDIPITIIPIALVRVTIEHTLAPQPVTEYIEGEFFNPKGMIIS